MRCEKVVKPLADFALILLNIVLNSAGEEREFSGMGITKSKLRNRIAVEKLKQHSQVSQYPFWIIDTHFLTKVLCGIREDQRTGGGTPIRLQRRNHKDTNTLLALQTIPEIRSVSPTEDDGGHQEQRTTIRSREEWRRMLAEWQERRANISEDPRDYDVPGMDADGSDLLPITLKKLFLGRPPAVEAEAGQVTIGEASQRKRRRLVISEEARLLELIAAEESDEAPDDGALDGSEDDYDDGD